MWKNRRDLLSCRNFQKNVLMLFISTFFVRIIQKKSMYFLAFLVIFEGFQFQNTKKKPPIMYMYNIVLIIRITVYCCVSSAYMQDWTFAKYITVWYVTIISSCILYFNNVFNIYVFITGKILIRWRFPNLPGDLFLKSRDCPI